MASLRWGAEPSLAWWIYPKQGADDQRRFLGGEGGSVWLQCVPLGERRKLERVGGLP
jgi:hypothetical protein